VQVGAHDALGRCKKRAVHGQSGAAVP